MPRGRFEDERGVIQDMITEPLDAVTEIFTRAGAVRGNHTHAETVQWTYIVSGTLQVVQRWPGGMARTWDYGAGEMVCDPAGVAHAWQALEDTHVLVFTRGPRSGANYEDDVQRLAPEERLIGP
jgi:quercetin dioxygenase-like cupin family protein